MMHIRTDHNELNSQREFACGIGPALPEGDQWVGVDERGLHHMVNCPGCEHAKNLLGTPISELSGRPGEPGYARFKEIAKSWGYE